jgi:hypothetical protein
VTPEERRERRLQMLDDDIGRALEISHNNGELRSAPSWGRPLQLGDGYEQTPNELRMGFKMLKDAGVIPHEVLLMKEIAALKAGLEAETAQSPNYPPSAQHQTQLQQLQLKQQQLAMRLEKLRTSGTL